MLVTKMYNAHILELITKGTKGLSMELLPIVDI